MLSASHEQRQTRFPRRSERFIDTDFPKSPRLTNQPNPFATKQPPSDFKIIQKLLIEEQKNSVLYSQVWAVAESVYKNKKKNPSNSSYFISSTPKECYVAIIAYTLDDKVNGKKLYQDFNLQFRLLTDEESWRRFPYKSFYYLITLARPGIKNNPEIDRYLYRGVPEKGKKLIGKPKIGDLFYFDYFASSSIDPVTADDFRGPNGLMIEIRNGATVACGIDKYSLFSENEVLIFPRNKFKVVKYEDDGFIARLVLDNIGYI